jgi:hypothetical protein
MDAERFADALTLSSWSDIPRDYNGQSPEGS